MQVLLPARLGTGYRWLLASSWTSNLGDGLAAAAGPLLVASLTGNAFLEVKVHDLAEITCPACLALAGTQAPNNDTEREGKVNHSHPA